MRVPRLVGHRAEFPADRDQLLDSLDERTVPEWARALVSALPTGKAFTNYQEVWTALGGHVESHRF